MTNRRESMGEEDRTIRAAATGVLKAQQKFAEYLGKGDVELQAFATFCLIAARPSEFPMADLTDILGLSQSSISRNVALLSIGSVKAPGPQLIEAYEDPEYRRRKYVRLTTRGKRLAAEIAEILHAVCKKMSGAK
jgi:DNA-binding MarR family transcriptional regulator